MLTDLLTRIERGEPVEAQEVFDFAVGKVIEQGVQARDKEYQCVYRGMNGTKCSFGHVIPDALYKKSMERSSAFALLGACPYYSPPDIKALQPSLGRHVDLIYSLQQAHDNVHAGDFVPNFRRRAEAVAATHGLTFKF